MACLMAICGDVDVANGNRLVAPPMPELPDVECVRFNLCAKAF